jgi:predicted DnaQ family exonuclease/DinG family helicase
MRTFVALDLETTGLDVDRDTILEIGAVKFKGNRVEDEYSTLVNPGRPISAFISQLTGITDAMVAGKPFVRQVLPELDKFVGDAVIVGHNIKFDLGFLRKQKLFVDSDQQDTYDLAAVLIPAAGRYSLGSLAQALNIILPATHRALDDARVTHALYRQLFEKALTLPLDVLAEIVNVGQAISWGGDLFFEEALAQRSKEKQRGPLRVSHEGVAGPLFADQGDLPKALKPTDTQKPLDVPALAALISPDGAFQHKFPAFENRAQQVQMLESVATAFNEGKHLMVEAGTGTGKCLTGDTWITFKSGRRIQICDLLQEPDTPSEPILSIDPSGKLLYQPIQSVHNNGLRKVWRLKTGLGRAITATSNHPLLTLGGWKPLGELQVGDRIATLRSLPSGQQRIEKHEAFVAGTMLGDGSCSRPDSLRFTNFDPGVVEAMEVAVAKLGNVRLTTNKAKGHYGFKRLSLMGHQRSGLNRLLERLDIIGKDALSKHIPAPFFEAEADSLACFLAGLWVTDGSIESRDGHPSYCSASYRLIYEMQHLLLKLEIISRVRYKQVHIHSKKFDSWHLIVSDHESKLAFGKTIGKYLVGERQHKYFEWWHQHSTQKYNPNDDLVPVEGWSIIDKERERVKQSWYAIRTHCVVSSDRSREISRAKMMNIGDFLQSKEVKEVASSDLYWDRIAAIEFIGEAETFDLTMEGEPNFVANDIIVHNSVAYLLPAIHWAVQNNERVVISTNTINLQDQLINKDVPALHEVLDFEFRATLLKGRSNYICPRRFEGLRRRGPRNADEMRLLGKLLVWLPESTTGDVSEITLSGPGERGAWTRMSAEDEACTTVMCSTKMAGICPFYRSRRSAEAAHVVIVNHALLLADVASGSQVLPEYKRLVIDEGHHLESATTDGLSYEVTQADVERMLRDLGGPSSGQLGETLRLCRSAVPPEIYPVLATQAEKTYTAITTMMVHVSHFFSIVSDFMKAQRAQGRGNEYSFQLRLLPNTRTSSDWQEVELAWSNLIVTAKPVIDHLTKLAGGLSDLSEYEIEDVEGLQSSLMSPARQLDEFANQTNGLVVKPDPKNIYWIEASGDNERLSLHVAPLHVGPLIEQHMWNSKDAVVLTSATLTTAQEFDYIKHRLNADKAGELAVGSPFDYQKSTLLYIVNDIPEPTDKFGHQKWVEQGMINLCKATGGRAMALFTSHAQMKQTAQAIRGPLERAGILVYDQSEGASRHQLLESFRNADQAVLLGTRSFWEGVDVQGGALSALVIVKLPFDVPTDPIVAARSETFENPFYDYSVPEAILRFRQGFGRLIRSKTDRGVVAIFDRRVLTKAYGRQFIDSLPQCTRRDGKMADLPAIAAKWIDLK